VLKSGPLNGYPPKVRVDALMGRRSEHGVGGGLMADAGLDENLWLRVVAVRVGAQAVLPHQGA